MKKTICFLLTLILLCSLSGCKDKDAELLGNYKAKDSVVHNDVGAMVEASYAPLLTDFFVCDITHDMLSSDYVFDEEKPDRKGCAFVINRTKNELVFGYRMDELFFPASITKLMTALVTMNRCKMDDKVVITKEMADFKRGSVVTLNEGDVLTVYDLLLCMLVSSANNAANALAIHVAGSEEAFVGLMNSEMKKLGGTTTNFVNASGLHHDKHKTTPYDMYIVYQECMKSPEFREIMKITKTTYHYYDANGSQRSREVMTTNCFKLNDPKHSYPFPNGVVILGGKTGTTDYAGYCMLLHIKNSFGTEYILGVYGAKTEEKLYTKLNDLMSTYCIMN